jgi:hypothetical protein
MCNCIYWRNTFLCFILWFFLLCPCATEQWLAYHWWYAYHRLRNLALGECWESTLKLGCDRLLPNPFQFIIHSVYYHRFIRRYIRRFAEKALANKTQIVFLLTKMFLSIELWFGSDRKKNRLLWVYMYGENGADICWKTALVARRVKQSRYTPWRCLGERRYSSYSFTTSTLYGGEWSASRPGRALPPGKGPPVPIGQETGWAPEPVWTQRIEENPLPLPGIEPRSSSP